MIPNSDDSWKLFMERFASSVRPIVGSQNVISLSEDHKLAEEELEGLRDQVERLMDEVCPDL